MAPCLLTQIVHAFSLKEFPSRSVPLMIIGITRPKREDLLRGGKTALEFPGEDCPTSCSAPSGSSWMLLIKSFLRASPLLESFRLTGSYRQECEAIKTSATFRNYEPASLPRSCGIYEKGVHVPAKSISGALVADLVEISPPACISKPSAVSQIRSKKAFSLLNSSWTASFL